MKAINQTNNNNLIRFDQNDDVLTLLATYCREKNINAASFSALGAAGEIVLSYYNLVTKQYEDHTFTENVEIVNITGNVAVMNGNHIIHAHGVFGRKDYSTIGGHIKKLIVSATCEVSLTALEGTIQRAFDEKTGLNLLI